MKEKESKDKRLVKVIAEAGIASRRKCEKIIESKRVRVNNCVIIDPAYKVNDEDTVSVDRQIIERETKRYIALYKPLGVVSTTKKLPGRRVIAEFFKDIKERLFYAGRLDSESRGIMIITNDGEFANIITHPSYEILKVYDVTVGSRVETEKILKASKGITIKNIRYSPFKFTVLSKGRLQSKIRLTINEGKNREIRKIFEYLGYKVVDLERISVGCVSKFHPDLGALEAGHTRALSKEEINFFFDKKKSMYKNISAENIDNFDFSLTESDVLENISKEEEKNTSTKKNKKVKKHNKALWAKSKIKQGKTKNSKTKTSVKVGKKLFSKTADKTFNKSSNKYYDNSPKKVFSKSFNDTDKKNIKKSFGVNNKKSFKNAGERYSKNISKKIDARFKKDNKFNKDTKFNVGNKSFKTKQSQNTYSKKSAKPFNKNSKKINFSGKLINI